MRTPLCQRIAAIAHAVAPIDKKNVPRMMSITWARSVARAVSAGFMSLSRMIGDTSCGGRDSNHARWMVLRCGLAYADLTEGLQREAESLLLLSHLAGNFLVDLG